MYNKYPETQDLYVLHKYNIGMSQGDESFLEEIIATGNDKEVLEQKGKELYPNGSVSTAGGWRQEHWALVINTSTEAGRAMHEAQKAIWEQQWKGIDEHPEDNEGWFIGGNRRIGGPIKMKMEHNPTLDNVPKQELPTSSYQFIVFDISDKPTENEQ